MFYGYSDIIFFLPQESFFSARGFFSGSEKKILYEEKKCFFDTPRKHFLGVRNNFCGIMSNVREKYSQSQYICLSLYKNIHTNLFIRVSLDQD